MFLTEIKIRKIIKKILLKEFGDWGDVDLTDDPESLNKPTGLNKLLDEAEKNGIVYWPDLFMYSTFFGQTDVSVNGYFTFKEHPSESEEILKAGTANPIFKEKISGCAQWVGKFVGKLGADAWTAHSNYRGKRKFSIFDNQKENYQKLADIFSQCNKNYPDSLDDPILLSDIMNMAYTMAGAKPVNPSSINLGDVVGMLYHETSFMGKSFMEGATGHKNIEKNGGIKSSAGPYFIDSETKKPWKKSDLGKDINYIPGKTLGAGNAFGFNTHVGLCGAKVNGVPIIYHAYHGEGTSQFITATPLTTMGPQEKFCVAWVKSI